MSTKWLKELVRVFVFAFLGIFLPALSGIWLAPDWNAQKALAVSAFLAGVSAAVKAVTDFLTKGVTPVPQAGILPPSIKN